MRLVRSGYSWSGGERNCVFLNTGSSTGSPRFANVSAISGLGFADDARALAIVDWDNDGDLDAWLRNRSAPRLRLLRNSANDSSAKNNSVILELAGTTSNSDAIGARAEIVLRDSGQRHVRSVRAGDGFLSQSSRRLHFGMKETAVIEKLIVNWPDGQLQEFRGIEVGNHYRIVQGFDRPNVVPRRAELAFSAKRLEPLLPTSAARVVLPTRILHPPILVRSDEGSKETIRFETPILVTYWSSTCANCCRELTEIARNASELKQADLEVLAISLDGVTHEKGVGDVKESKNAALFLNEISFPFSSAVIDSNGIRLVKDFQDAIFDTQPDFVVPLSFLVDAGGDVVVIYRGAFPPDTFLRDLDLLRLDEVGLRSAAPPMQGTWITHPATRAQFRLFMAGRLRATQPEAAAFYEKSAVSRGLNSGN